MSKHSSSNSFLPYDPGIVALTRKLHKSATLAERKLWFEFLRGYEPHFYFQRPIDHFVVDFYCPSICMVIELDGDIHAIGDAEEKDAARTKILESYGLRVVRYTNRDVLEHFDDVVSEIECLCRNDLE
jgi:very-short-patch-repair endonuclease